MDQKYCDGVEEISITSGIVRVDLYHYTAGPKDKEGRPARELSHRVLLSPEAFVQTYTAFEQVVKQLQEKGLLQRKDGAGAAAGAGAKGAPAGAPARSAAPVAKPGKSPNF
jgi:hypothetical protein